MAIARRSPDTPDPDDQQERTIERAGIAAGWDGDSSGFNRDVLRYLAQTDIPESSKNRFLSLLSRDWVFANLSNADYNELKWELRHLKHLFYDMHPSHECLVVGDVRAAINDDPRDTLRPLSEDDKREVEQLFRAIRLRLTRSKGMRQQSIIQTNISQTEVARSSDKNGSFLSRFKK